MHLILVYSNWLWCLDLVAVKPAQFSQVWSFWILCTHTDTHTWQRVVPVSLLFHSSRSQPLWEGKLASARSSWQDLLRAVGSGQKSSQGFWSVNLWSCFAKNEHHEFLTKLFSAQFVTITQSSRSLLNVLTHSCIGEKTVSNQTFTSSCYLFSLRGKQDPLR